MNIPKVSKEYTIKCITEFAINSSEYVVVTAKYYKGWGALYINGKLALQNYNIEEIEDTFADFPKRVKSNKIKYIKIPKDIAKRILPMRLEDLNDIL